MSDIFATHIGYYQATICHTLLPFKPLSPAVTVSSALRHTSSHFNTLPIIFLPYLIFFFTADINSESPKQVSTREYTDTLAWFCGSIQRLIWLMMLWIISSSSSCYDDTNYLVRSSSRPTALFHSVRFCASLFEVVIDIPISPQFSCMLSSHLLLGRPRGRVPCSCPYSKIFGSRRLSIRAMWP